MRSKKWEVLKPITLIVIFLWTIYGLSGCATHQTTTRTTTSSRSAQEEIPATSTTTQKDVVVSTEQSSTSESKPDGGIFGGVFHLLGEILAFPFRMIGEAFDALF
jgi:hypothetical protein